MFYRTHYVALVLCTLSTPTVRAEPTQPFELRDGDRVIFVGDTLIEREQYFGFIELALTTRFPDRNVTFRNIGWSADTPAGESRCGLSLLQAGHEPPEEGWRQLKEQLHQLRPTVVIIGYGMASSFAGKQGLPRFVAQMNRLLETIQESETEHNIRFLLLSPIPHLPSAALPDTTDHNKQLALVADAIRDIAAQRGAPFISLYHSLNVRNDRANLTDNGIHLNAAGYRVAAEIIENGLGWPSGSWRESPQSDRLRRIILKKNAWFFHRSRPANMAYIFGFRKAEQGRNAVEIPQFDLLIEAEEKIIAKLRSLQPVEIPPEPPPQTHPMEAKLTPQPRPTFEVGNGLEAVLWAENPLLHKPIQMNFDPQGRLWVASSEVYPQIEPGQTANDKIIILEDTTGEGKANKATVFADGLLIPTGLEPGDGGVYVAQSTELLHFADTRKTGKADTRRIVLSGFGTEDTHHNLHTLRWGPDGRLWMNQSIYTRTDTETPYGVFRHKSGGVMRLDTRAVRMEVVYKGWWNSWGHQFDPFGQSFITDGAGGDGVSYGLPGEIHEGYARARHLLGSISPGGYPKFCGLEIVHSTQFPDDWQGNIITCDFRANRVVRFQVTEDGAGYVARPMPDVMRSREVSFRPIDAKLGPDGALYIADWSNPIINHGEVDFRDPRRDREHGRIWRVSWKDRPLNPRPQLVSADTAALFDHLLSPNSYESAQARRVLIERGTGILPDLQRWQAQHVSEPALLQALWLKQALNQVDAKLVHRVLAARDGRIRAAAIRVLSDWIKTVPDAQALLAKLVIDEHPRVRLEAIRAIARIPTAAAADSALRALDRPRDRFIDYALWLTVNDLSEPWLDALASGASQWDGREQALEFAITAVDPDKAGKALATLLDRRPLPREARGPWIELIGKAGGPAELRRLFDQAAQGRLDEAATIRAFAALAEAVRLRNQKPGGDLSALDQFLDRGAPAQRTAAIRLAGQWHMNQLLTRIAALAADRNQASDLRIVAIEALRELRDASAIPTIRKLVEDARELPALRRQAALAMLLLDRDGALPLIHKMLEGELSEAEAVAFWRSLLSVTNVSHPLAEALRKEPIPASMATLGLRVARENANSHRDLMQILERIAGVPAPKEYTTAEIQRISILARQRGNSERGELVYRRPDLRCVACHSIGGTGGKVGPDLTSLGASAPLDYITESIYLPNKQIKEGFHAVLLATADGKTLTGIPVTENNQELVIRDANDKLITVPKKDIEQRGQAASLMPSGLIDNLFEQERWDLIRFLSELGRPGPFDATKSQAVKLWRVMTADGHGKTELKRIHGGDSSLGSWTLIPTMVVGALPKSEVQALKASNHEVFLATRFEFTKAGKATFHFGDARVKSLWVDGKQHGFAKDLALSLESGTHTLVALIDVAAIPDRMVLRCGDVVFRND